MSRTAGQLISESSPSQVSPPGWDCKGEDPRIRPKEPSRHLTRCTLNPGLGSLSRHRRIRARLRFSARVRFPPRHSRRSTFSLTEEEAC
jgi:hypothetical protein